ncbi:hypothetical protein BAY59_10865 [Prauserella coralliicola]|nr:hypothetical protein BAY59_10865 [Prauserella coralliicola]
MKPPKHGTPEYRLWRQGALDEHAAIVEGMTKSGREAFDVVQVLAQQGRDAGDIAESVARIWSPLWPMRRRLRLAWRLVMKR